MSLSCKCWESFFFWRLFPSHQIQTHLSELDSENSPQKRGGCRSASIVSLWCRCCCCCRYDCPWSRGKSILSFSVLSWKSLKLLEIRNWNGGTVCPLWATCRFSMVIHLRPLSITSPPPLISFHLPFLISVSTPALQQVASCQDLEFSQARRFSSQRLL